ncbi:MAG: DNA/RNA non-specific endonuclease [Moraxella sp.]|nr:DNA/RNA non-specific endonuclease [Moraxella sp.]
MIVSYPSFAVSDTTPNTISDTVSSPSAYSPLINTEQGFEYVPADGSYYNDDYAQDFVRCTQHFAHGVLPVLDRDLQSDTYPLCFYQFAVMYSGKTRTAVYVAQHLTREQVSTARQLERVDNFHPESRLPTGVRADIKDYRGTGYDRGHLAPNGDMSNQQSQFDSFSLANIVPQDSTHNRELWREIESVTRDLADNYGEIYVITGTAFADTQVDKVGKIFVPTHLYKVVYVPSIAQAAVYYSANQAGASYEVLDVQELTARTGVNVLPNVQVSLLPLPSVYREQEQDAQAVSWREFIRHVWDYLWQALG